MRYFSEIIRVIESLQDTRIEIADEDIRTSEESQLSKLYSGIRVGTIANDSDAARILYGAPSLDTRYTTLKSRLKRRLLNGLFHLDLRRAGYSQYSQAIYKSRKRVFIVNTLIHLGARTTGSRLAASALAEALRYGLTIDVLELAFQLRNNAGLTNDVKAYDRFNSIVHISLDTLQAEYLSWEYYELAIRDLSSVTNTTTEFSASLKIHIEELRPAFERLDSFTLSLNYFRLRIFFAESRSEPQETVSVCDEAIAYLLARPHLYSNPRLAEFSIKKLEAHIVLRDYAEGSKAATECASLLKPGTNVWFAYAENYLLLHMHTEHFIEAEALFSEVTSHPRFEALPDLWKEQWKIFELYLLFALRSRPEYDTLPIQKKFDLKSFLRFVPVAAKDKHGMYIAVLIAHVLYTLEAGDFDDIIVRMESLKTYRSKYLRASANRRSSLFFRMLTIMENNSFSYTLTKKKSEPYFRKLLETKAEQSETNEELQVIPYEWLWRRVLDLLRDYEIKHPYGRRAISEGE